MTYSTGNKEVATTLLKEELNRGSIINEEQEYQIFLKNEEIFKSYSFYFCKRGIDIILSLCGLIFLSSLFLIIAILIKKEDKEGPILFKQPRVGKNGEIFYMYKFRSMVHNAEEILESILHLNEVEGAMFKIKEDPRVTKVGRFIRASSIDEFPQLWNVLKGEMSLVGPRPPLLREVNSYNTFEKQRLLVKPGCTGLWQATFRNEVGFNEMVKLDIEYIKNQSIILDIKIILLTVKSLILKKAY